MPNPLRLQEPFHPGEIAVQRRTGQRATALRVGRVLAHDINHGARVFLAEQRTLGVGLTDDAGRVWATLWVGPPGFASSSDGLSVRIVRAIAVPSNDPVEAGLEERRAIALLAIDFRTRKRLRVNGTLNSFGASFIEVAVREAFPNCPKYIQRRELTLAAPTFPAKLLSEGTQLTRSQQHLVAHVDTALVASVHPERGADVSHRGGEPGFIRVLDERTLRIPDYAGNGMFQTLGNFTIDPRAGLTLLDLNGGKMLMLTGRARIEFDSEGPDRQSGGTGRYWQFNLDQFREVDLPATSVAGSLEPSPFNPVLGDGFR
jgi:predicted pyridoxine 5'-phosphate oxidase superfamily flavin-nucleotide-binding protein